jgi:hypothetical protein
MVKIVRLFSSRRLSYVYRKKKEVAVLVAHWPFGRITGDGYTTRYSNNHTKGGLKHFDGDNDRGGK